MSLNKEHYFLAPVEVVRVNSQNLEEAAEWCGGQVESTESRRRPGTQDSYVNVPTPKGSAISWAFPGMYITKRLVVNEKGDLKSTYAVYRRSYFDVNYFATPQEATERTWERNEKELARLAEHIKEENVPKAKNIFQNVRAKVVTPEPTEPGIFKTSEGEDENLNNVVVNPVIDGAVRDIIDENLWPKELEGLTESDIEKIFETLETDDQKMAFTRNGQENVLFLNRSQIEEHRRSQHKALKD